MSKKKTFLIALTIVLIIILLIVIALNTINFSKSTSNKDKNNNGEVLDLSDKVEGVIDTPDEYAYLLETVYGEKGYTFELIREEEKNIIFKKVDKKNIIQEIYVVDKDSFEAKIYNEDTAMDNNIIEDTRPKETDESDEDMSAVGGA